MIERGRITFQSSPGYRKTSPILHPANITSVQEIPQPPNSIHGESRKEKKGSVEIRLCDKAIC
jgi:hypothetical protein